MFNKPTVSNDCECLKLIAMLQLREVRNANIAKAVGITPEVLLAQAKKVFEEK